MCNGSQRNRMGLGLHPNLCVFHWKPPLNRNYSDLPHALRRFTVHMQASTTVPSGSVATPNEYAGNQAYQEALVKYRAKQEAKVAKKAAKKQAKKEDKNMKKVDKYAKKEAKYREKGDYRMQMAAKAQAKAEAFQASQLQQPQESK